MVSQQAAEKGLKALYLEQRGVLAPRTHDLRFLGGEVDVPREQVADLALLNPTFDLVRYPDPSSESAPVDEVTETLASTHVAAMERILTWLTSKLPSS